MALTVIAICRRRRLRVGGQDNGIGVGSAGMRCPTVAYIAVDPGCAVHSSVDRPETHHQAETQPRPNHPHRKDRINQNPSNLG